MLDFEVYLSRGILEKISIKESLFDMSKQIQCLEEEDRTEIRLENIVPILIVKELHNFEYSNEKGQRFGIILSDGDDELTVTIDPGYYSLLCSGVEKHNLKQGSVILLRKYKIVSIDDILTKEELEIEKVKKKNVLCITELILIGHYCQSSVNNEESQINCLPLDLNVKNTTVDKDNVKKVTHFILDLDTSFSKIEWAICCQVVEKSAICQYENRQNGQIGKYQRFLLKDDSALIEMVVFNKFCESKSICELEKSNFLIIKNCDIKVTKSTLKNWKEYETVDKEIHVNTKSVIEKCNYVLYQKKSRTLDDQLIGNKEIISKKDNSLAIINLTNNPKIHNKFTPIKDLIYSKPNCYIDVIGIISEINALKTMNSTSSLSLRNIKIIDQSNIPVSVAFWGKQAENFDHKVGTCLMINNVKVTNYGGVSLSVMRSTALMEIKQNYDIEAAKEIFKWWEEKNVQN